MEKKNRRITTKRIIYNQNQNQSNENKNARWSISAECSKERHKKKKINEHCKGKHKTKLEKIKSTEKKRNYKLNAKSEIEAWQVDIVGKESSEK